MSGDRLAGKLNGSNCEFDEMQLDEILLDEIRTSRHRTHPSSLPRR